MSVIIAKPINGESKNTRQPKSTKSGKKEK